MAFRFMAVEGPDVIGIRYPKDTKEFEVEKDPFKVGDEVLCYMRDYSMTEGCAMLGECNVWVRGVVEEIYQKNMAYVKLDMAGFGNESDDRSLVFQDNHHLNVVKMCLDFGERLWDW